MRGLLAIGLLGLLSSCGVTFKTLTLEDNLPKPKPIVGLGDFTATTVFKNSIADMWVAEFPCQTVEPTSVAAEGDQALQLEWDRGGCEWAGFGIGWDAWQPKDLSQIMDRGAVEFKIRSIEGETSIPLIIFLLEDYGGEMTAAVFGASCLERYPLNETWQTAQVPLSWFPYQENGVDVTNIKQMVFEFQNSGACLIDDMRIVEYEPMERPASSRINKPSVVALENSVLFQEEFANVWGLGSFECRDYSITQEEAFSGQSALAIHHSASCTDLQWNRMGISWTQWLAVDFSEKEAYFEAWIKTAMDEPLSSNHLYVGLESYTGANGRVRITDDHVQRKDRGWMQVRVPLSETGVGTEKLPADRIKQLFLETTASTNLWLDELRITTP